jgi:hypothetical protein
MLSHPMPHTLAKTSCQRAHHHAPLGQQRGVAIYEPNFRHGKISSLISLVIKHSVKISDSVFEAKSVLARRELLEKIFLK